MKLLSIITLFTLSFCTLTTAMHHDGASIEALITAGNLDAFKQAETQLEELAYWEIKNLLELATHKQTCLQIACDLAKDTMWNDFKSIITEIQATGEQQCTQYITEQKQQAGISNMQAYFPDIDEGFACIGSVAYMEQYLTDELSKETCEVNALNILAEQTNPVSSRFKAMHFIKKIGLDDARSNVLSQIMEHHEKEAQETLGRVLTSIAFWVNVTNITADERTTMLNHYLQNSLQKEQPVFAHMSTTLQKHFDLFEVKTIGDGKMLRFKATKKI